MAAIQRTPELLARLTELYLLNWSFQRIGQDIGVSKSATARIAASLDLPKRAIADIEIAKRAKGFPDGFADDSIDLSIVELSKKYNIPTRKINHMINALPADVRAQRTAKSAERYRRAMAKQWEGLSADERRERTKAGRKKSCTARAIKRRAGSVSPVNWGIAKPTPIADVPGGIGQRAVDFLKRHYVPAFNAERVYGKQWAGLFIVGRLQLDTEGVLDLAERHGFDAGEWRRLAA
jgi:hypothetical protein